MKQITVHDAFTLIILFCIIALLFQCYTMDMTGKKSNKREFGKKHRTLDYPYEIKMIIANELLKHKIWGKGEPCGCGLNKEDFEAYVAWKTEGIDVDHITWQTRKTLHGEICIGWAWVFTKKEAKDEED